jgi:hypothetical protein
MEASSDRTQRKDDRSVAWFDFESAQRNLTHADNQTLLSKAERKLESNQLTCISELDKS